MKDSIGAYYARRPYGRFEQDGKNHHVFWARYVTDTPSRDRENKKVTVTLDAGDRTISAEYKKLSFPKRMLKVALDSDGRVCLSKEGGECGSTEDAAAYFLDPFLFPDLAGSKPLPSEAVYDKSGGVSL